MNDPCPMVGNVLRVGYRDHELAVFSNAVQQFQYFLRILPIQGSSRLISDNDLRIAG